MEEETVNHKKKIGRECERQSENAPHKSVSPKIAYKSMENFPEMHLAVFDENRTDSLSPLLIYSNCIESGKICDQMHLQFTYLPVFTYRMHSSPCSLSRVNRKHINRNLIQICHTFYSLLILHLQFTLAKHFKCIRVLSWFLGVIRELILHLKKKRCHSEVSYPI